MIVLATARDQVADFVLALVEVYFILIIAYILMQLFMNFGGRIPYSIWSRRVMDFLSETVEPYLSIFRRVLPPFGGFDFSPIIAIIVLQLVGNLVANLVRG